MYISLGISKGNLFLQAAMEGLMLYMASFLLSGFLTYSLLPPLSSRLEILEGAIGSWKADYAGGLLTLSCGLGILLLLTGIAIFPYFKKHPKEILSEMEG